MINVKMQTRVINKIKQHLVFFTVLLSKCPNVISLCYSYLILLKFRIQTTQIKQQVEYL